MVRPFDIFSGEGLRDKRSNGQKMAGLPEGRVKMESKKVRICAIFHLLCYSFESKRETERNVCFLKCGL